MLETANPEHSGFNSILVRLKGAGKYRGIAGEVRFNSILVRLKDSVSGSDFTIDSKFQFHTGSIKSVLSSVMLVVMVSFNSILVRLKVGNEQTAIYPLEEVSIPYWFD